MKKCLVVFLQILISFLIVVVTGVNYAYANINSDTETRLLCEIQERLSVLGFSPGPIDGQVGKRTRNAVGLFLATIKPKGETFSVEEVVNFIRSYQVEKDSVVVRNKDITLLTRPRNGQVFYQNGKDELAPLKVKTAKQGYDYYIKLSEHKTNYPVKTVYLRSGSSILMKTPLGIFQLKYATGEQWYGETCLFGYKTRYNKADREFEFKQVGNQYSGYTVELIVQEGGNLSTEQLSPEEW